MSAATEAPRAGEPSLVSGWTPFRIGWAAIVLVTVSVRAYTLASWSWFQDDYLFIAGVDELPFTDYLLQDYNSHLQPGQFVIVWVITKIDPLNYGLASLVTCVFVVTSLVAWGLALRTIFGERIHVLAALVLLGLSPILVSVSLWWAAALSVYPLYTFMGLSVWFMARYLMGGQHRRDLVWLTLTYAVGLVFWQKSVLITVPLLFLVLLLGPRSRRETIRLAVVSLAPAALLTVAYMLFYALAPRPGGTLAEVTPPRGRSVGEMAEFYVRGTLDVLLPGLLGGPFNTLSSANGTYSPASGSLSLVLWGLTIVAVLVGVLYRRRGGVAVLMSVTYALVSWGLILFSYRYDAVGVYAVRAARYTSDLLPIALLTVMFLITPVRGTPPADTLRRPVSADTALWLRRGRVGYLALVTVVALVLTGRTWDQTSPTSPEPWFSNFTADARSLPAGTTLLDNPPPPGVISSDTFGAAARQSFVLKSLHLPLRFDEPTEQLVVADASGHLYNGELNVPAEAAPGPDEGCGYSVTDDAPTRISLGGELYYFGWVVEITYFVGSDAAVLVDVGNDVSVTAQLAATASGVVKRQQIYLAASIAEVSLLQTDGADPICVTDVRVGELVPGPQRPVGLGPVD